mgnify:CR=1 FL=1
MIVEVTTLVSILVIAYLTKKSYDRAMETRAHYEQGIWELNQKILANKGAIHALQFHAERNSVKTITTNDSKPKAKRGRPRKNKAMLPLGE